MSQSVKSSMFGEKGVDSLHSLICEVVDDKNRRVRRYRPSPHPFTNDDADTPNLSENSDVMIPAKRVKVSVPALEGITEGWDEEQTPVKPGNSAKKSKTLSSPYGIPMPTEIIEDADSSAPRVYKGTPRKENIRMVAPGESPMTRARRKELGEEYFMELLPPSRKRQPTPAIRKARGVSSGFLLSPEESAKKALFTSPPPSMCALESIDLTNSPSLENLDGVTKELFFDSLDESLIPSLDDSLVVAVSVNDSKTEFQDDFETENFDISAMEDYTLDFSEQAVGMLNEWHELNLGVSCPCTEKEPVFPPAQLPPRFHRDQPKQVRWANVSVAEFDQWPDWGKVPCIDDEFYAVGLSPYLTSAYLRTIDDYEEWKEQRGVATVSSVDMKLRKYYWYRCYADLEAHRVADQDASEIRVEPVLEAMPTTSISGQYLQYDKVQLRGVWGVVSDEGNTIQFDQYTPGRVDTAEEVAQKQRYVEYQCFQAKHDLNDQPRQPSLDINALHSFYTAQCTTHITRSIYKDMLQYLSECQRDDWSCFNDITDQEDLRLGRQSIGCNCVHVHGDCIEQCECEVHEISCLGDLCGCTAEGCTNIYGRFYYDDVKVTEFTRRVAKQANKYIYAYKQWELDPSIGDMPCDYGIPPIRADALRIKLMRTLPPSQSRIPECNTLHVLPPENLMSWQKDDAQ